MRTFDLLLLMRTLDPEVGRKEAATRRASAVVPLSINVLSLDAPVDRPASKRKKKKKKAVEAPAPARESYEAYPPEVLTLDDVPGRPESAGLRLTEGLRSPFLNAGSRPNSRGWGSRPGTAGSDKSVTWKLPSLPAVKQSRLGAVDAALAPAPFPAPLVNRPGEAAPPKKKKGFLW